MLKTKAKVISKSFKTDENGFQRLTLSNVKKPISANEIQFKANNNIPRSSDKQ